MVCHLEQSWSNSVHESIWGKCIGISCKLQTLIRLTFVWSFSQNWPGIKIIRPIQLQWLTQSHTSSKKTYNPSVKPCIAWASPLHPRPRMCARGEHWHLGWWVCSNGKIMGQGLAGSRLGISECMAWVQSFINLLFAGCKHWPYRVTFAPSYGKAAFADTNGQKPWSRQCEWSNHNHSSQKRFLRSTHLLIKWIYTNHQCMGSK